MGNEERDVDLAQPVWVVGAEVERGAAGTLGMPGRARRVMYSFVGGW